MRVLTAWEVRLNRHAVISGTNLFSLATPGVLAGRVERGLVSAISNSAIKGRYWTGLAVPRDIGNS